MAVSELLDGSENVVKNNNDSIIQAKKINLYEVSTMYKAYTKFKPNIQRQN